MIIAANDLVWYGAKIQACCPFCISSLLAAVELPQPMQDAQDYAPKDAIDVQSGMFTALNATAIRQRPGPELSYGRIATIPTGRRGAKPAGLLGDSVTATTGHIT
jgi:hypothetical protein